MVAEFTVGSFVPFTTIFTTGVTWGIAWRLPTHSYELYLNKRAVGEDPDQQHRAELLDDLVVFLDKFGLHGEHCVRRTLCDLQTPRTRRAAKGGFMEEVLKALFTFSGSDSQSGGPDSNSTCEARFPHGVSILDVRPDMYTDK
ncbi:uncharacterized protein LOC117647497 [Thrips palmi]|uniref:Uncharacterized protein LOC117647497 n=1 Tax=Thrips palmi TaxID=161013 RepID=A0A6P8ZQ31_THRPL|nr:uncharacterized protein LOC117647497 [Thrips palmi]